MQDDLHRAVFLSYASQDAPTARRICEALSGAGVEVWFDQSELVGGDAWDAKIRRQIAECALFLPLISGNTQARLEGYFRIEWRLAAQRTHAMAEEKAFLVPVVIDDTSDAEARVPGEFKAVQWTRLPGGEPEAAFVSRVKALLNGDLGREAKRPLPAGSARSASSPAAGGVGVAAPSAALAAGGRERRARWPWVLGVTVAGVAVAGWAFRQSWHRETNPAAVQSHSPEAAKSAGTQFPRDPDLARARGLIYSLGGIVEDFALADDLVRPLLTQRPNDPDTVTVAAEVATQYLIRGFDTSLTRQAEAQRLSERAVQLAPEHPVALAVLGGYLRYLGTQPKRAESLLRRAIALDPGEPRPYRLLLEVLGGAKNAAETDAFAATMVQQFPDDPLVRYDLSRWYKASNRMAEMEQALDECLARAPIPFAMIWKAWLSLSMRGDVAEMKTWLDRVPERQRTNTRFVNALAIHGIISGQPTAALRDLEALPNTWWTDFDFTGPRALLLGDLLTADRRPDLARLQYEIALSELQREMTRTPNDLRLRRAELWILEGLGRRDDARRTFQLLLQAQQRPLHWTMDNSWWSSLPRAGLLLGETGTALALLREVAADPAMRRGLRNELAVDPRLTSLRRDPTILAIVAEPAASK